MSKVRLVINGHRYISLSNNIIVIKKYTACIIMTAQNNLGHLAKLYCSQCCGMLRLS